MAYAELAGVPVSAGLYALLLPVLAYAFLGSAPRVVVGPEGTVALLVATAIAPLAASWEPRVRRAGRDARDHGGGRVPSGPPGPSRLDRRLLLAGSPGRLHHRSRHRADPRPARQAGRHLQRRGRRHPRDRRHPPPPRRRQRGHGRRRCPVPRAAGRGRHGSTSGSPARSSSWSLGIAASWALDLAGQGVSVTGPVPSGLPALEVPDVSARRPRHPRPRRPGRLPRRVLRLHPHLSLLRRPPPRGRRRQPGAARVRRRPDRRRRHPGHPGRDERVAHGGQRRHGCDQPGQRARRRRHHRRHPVVPHRPRSSTCRRRCSARSSCTRGPS